MPFKNWDKQSERLGHNEVTTVEVTHKLTRIGKKVPAGWRLFYFRNRQNRSTHSRAKPASIHIPTVTDSKKLIAEA